GLLELFVVHVFEVLVAAVVLGCSSHWHLLGHLVRLLDWVGAGGDWLGHGWRLLVGCSRLLISLGGSGRGCGCCTGCSCRRWRDARASSSVRQIRHHARRLLLAATCDEGGDRGAYCDGNQQESIQKRLHSF
ncbi:hypothetical protein PMAYCL1PPCAC_33506, partial [Pristionchus mayeri]